MFNLQSPFQPTGDQPKAIERLTSNLRQNLTSSVLVGVTGSGKTFTMAHTVNNLQKPTLVISPNKTLAAQLASEFKMFFPNNAVHYFVSYYDYYQPEAYLPSTDTYIAKDAAINEEIDRLRHAATESLLSRNDVIIVASVSCIYGLGSPEAYDQSKITLHQGKEYPRKKLLHELNSLKYTRNDVETARGTYQVKGETITVYPSRSLNELIRLTFWGDTLEKIEVINSLTKKPLPSTLNPSSSIDIFPATHYVAPEKEIPRVSKAIREELRERIKWFEAHDKPLEAERIKQRTEYDLEMMETTGYCNGIENYSRYFDGREPGLPPFTLIDYYRYANDNNWLLFIDESHMTVPQISGMYAGDKSRKQTLIDFGFRLPSALDNRPLTFAEFESKKPATMYVSATPGPYELRQTKREGIVEQLIRPTGLLEPTVEVRQTKNQIPDLIKEISARVKKHQRILVTTLTKRMAEELSEYLNEKGVKVQYLHSDVDTFDRLEILRDLRLGKYDVLVGINLLREGLDLPEVSLVAILDADKEGYLRSETALMQTMGRAARHVEGAVIMYADVLTGSIKRAIEEVRHRRKIQEEYNKEHSITPQSIKKAVAKSLVAGFTPSKKGKAEEIILPPVSEIPADQIPILIHELEQQMELAAKNLEFEKATALREKLGELKKVKIRRKR